MEKRYVIIGAGNGGQSLAGDMILRGLKLSAIYDINPVPIKDIKKIGGIKMSGPIVEGFAPVAFATDSLGEAMSAGNVFLVTIVSNFHPALAKQMAPFIKPEHTILLIPGNSGSSILFRRALEVAEVKEFPLIGESGSMPYATRLIGPAHAGIKARKAVLPIAALPAKRNKELFNIIKPVIPEIIQERDSLSVGMNNVNPKGHVPSYLFNLGKVEAPTENDKDFHAWGTKSTIKIEELYDKERMSVMNVLGLHPVSGDETSKMFYKGVHYVPLPQEKGISANAAQVPDRFIDEDVPLNMTLISDIGKKFNVPTPVTDLLIDIANIIRERDFRKDGTKLSNLGFEGKSVEEIQKYIMG